MSLLSNLTRSLKTCYRPLSHFHNGYNQLPFINLNRDAALPYMKLPEYDRIKFILSNAANANLSYDFKLHTKSIPNCFESKVITEFAFSQAFQNYWIFPENKFYVVMEEPMTYNIPLLTFPKSDIKWRRRRMRRHKLLRWRIRNPKIVKSREERKLQNRAKKQQENLMNSWKMFGLKSEPPKLTEEEKKKFVKQWREEGIWNESLTLDEYESFIKITSIMKATDKK